MKKKLLTLAIFSISLASVLQANAKQVTYTQDEALQIFNNLATKLVVENKQMKEELKQLSEKVSKITELEQRIDVLEKENNMPKTNKKQGIKLDEKILEYINNDSNKQNR